MKTIKRSSLSIALYFISYIQEFETSELFCIYSRLLGCNEIFKKLKVYLKIGPC